MLLAFGIVSGLLEACRSQRGQVLDAAMVDGVSPLGSNFHGLRQVGAWHDHREWNRLDGGAPFYGTYETSDHRWVAVAANEPKFYRVLVEALGWALEELPPQLDQGSWPGLKERFAEIFRTRTREEWVKLLQPLETCFSPVLALDEALKHEHSVARSFVPLDGVLQAAPAPRFGRTPGALARPAARPGEHTEEALRDWGFTPAEITDLETRQAIAQLPAASAHQA